MESGGLITLVGKTLKAKPEFLQYWRSVRWRIAIAERPVLGSGWGWRRANGGEHERIGAAATPLAAMSTRVRVRGAIPPCQPVDPMATNKSATPSLRSYENALMANALEGSTQQFAELARRYTFAGGAREDDLFLVVPHSSGAPDSAPACSTYGPACCFLTGGRVGAMIPP
jgi:hypothetical protein